MEAGQEPLPTKDTIRHAFRSFSIKSSLPLRASPLQSIPQVHKPWLPLRGASNKSAPAPENTPDSISDAELARFSRACKFTPRMPSVQPVLATRNKWWTASSQGRQCDTPDQPLGSAMRRHGVPLPAPVETKSARPVISVSVSRPSPFSSPSPEVISWITSPGSATLLHAPQILPKNLRVARAASAFDFTPAAAAIRIGPNSHDTRLCIAWRTERNSLLRHSKRAEQDALPRLPGALRRAKAHAPRTRRALSSLSGLAPTNPDSFPKPSVFGIDIFAREKRNPSLSGSPVQTIGGLKTLGYLELL